MHTTAAPPGVAVSASPLRRGGENTENYLAVFRLSPQAPRRDAPSLVLDFQKQAVSQIHYRAFSLLARICSGFPDRASRVTSHESLVTSSLPHFIQLPRRP